jgi:S-adenosyl methyltransferase
MSTDDVRPKIDTSVPHSARFWNYFLGGKDNYPVDRALGDQIAKMAPGLVDVARGSREYIIRSVTYLAGEVGIRQFLDVGTGLPTANNTHEVAQRVAPESRIVYVDNDPLVLAHARALLTSSLEGATDYVDADLHDPETILREAARTLDFTKPVALMLMGILGHVKNDDEVRSIIERLMDPLPSGSYLAHSDGTNTSPEMVAAQDQYNERASLPYYVRSPERIASFYEGLELVPPGIVRVTDWRPEIGPHEIRHAEAFGGVGRKP